MNENYSISQLGDLLVELGRKRHKNSGSAYAFAFGAVTGMLDMPLKYRTTEEIQKMINDRYLEVQKELAI